MNLSVLRVAFQAALMPLFSAVGVIFMFVARERHDVICFGLSAAAVLLFIGAGGAIAGILEMKGIRLADLANRYYGEIAELTARACRLEEENVSLKHDKAVLEEERSFAADRLDIEKRYGVEASKLLKESMEQSREMNEDHHANAMKLISALSDVEMKLGVLRQASKNLAEAIAKGKSSDIPRLSAILVAALSYTPPPDPLKATAAIEAGEAS